MMFFFFPRQILTAMRAAQPGDPGLAGRYLQSLKATCFYGWANVTDEVVNL